MSKTKRKGKDTKMSRQVTCTCKHCHAEFTTDSRHPHASCCGSPECRRAASRERSRRHYWNLKSHNPRAYGEMLARKKAERRRRRELALSGAVAARPLPPPRVSPASSMFVYAALAAVSGASGVAPLAERLGQLASWPAFRGVREEIGRFLAFAAGSNPDFCPAEPGAAPHA